MKTSIRKSLLTWLIAMLTVGYSTTSRFTLASDFDPAPIKSKTKMSVALQSMNSQLEQATVNPSVYVFTVRDTIDGTIKHHNYSDGPMSDSGRIQTLSTLSADTSPSYGLVVDRFPRMFKPVVNETVGLDRFGVPSQENLADFYPKLTAVANANRPSRDMPNVGAITPLIIDGAFTRNDSSHMRSKGYGSNGGYRGDADEEETGALDYGKSGSERSVTLVVNLYEPATNLVIGTEGDALGSAVAMTQAGAATGNMQTLNAIVYDNPGAENTVSQALTITATTFTMSQDAVTDSGQYGNFVGVKYD
ncbi:MAG: hypothetical protein ACI9WC_001537 [Arenicella sp.]|jgi:hypothetical protein